MAQQDTSAMTVKETFDYLAMQRNKGWPGSQSIGSKRKKSVRIPRDLDGAYRMFNRLDGGAAFKEEKEAA